MYKAKEIAEQAQDKGQVKHVIAVAAGKGGVGKSTVAVNLALALQSQGKKVGIFDADIYGPSVRKMLPEEHPPSQQGNQIIPAICYGGVRMMSMAYFRKDKEAAVIRAPIANGIIMQFIQNTAWGNLDYLLIDFPPGTGDIQLTLSQHANLLGALMVTTPQEIAVMDVRKAIDLFEKVHLPIIGIVENMSYYKDLTTGQKLHLFGKGGGRKLAKASGVPFLGEIPIDAEICLRGDSGEPLIVKDIRDTSDGAFAFLEFSKNFIQEVEALKNSTEGSLQNFVLTWKEIPADAVISNSKY
ncbi:MAG: Mrp/NBP35 family ATP-binding protein [Parachlamydiaceae bacterium]|nr:Mrp/NBP35 family ATP-binding protein [Parachlamydiaceae bacterium]